MRPTPIPDADLQANPALTRIVVGPPDGDLTSETIAPVEALAYRLPQTGELVYQIRLVLEDGELARLQDGAPVWLTVLGRLPPFEIKVSP